MEYKDCKRSQALPAGYRFFLALVVSPLELYDMQRLMMAP